ncbi:MAG: sugar transferase, partial [Wohlfahrtiimonas sp.]
MVHNQQRRHSRWYERLLFNFWFQLVAGFITVVLVPSIIMWPNLLKLYGFPSAVQLHTTLANAFAFLLSFVLYKKIQKFPGARLIIYLLPSVTISWACVIGIILLLRLDYSRSALLMSFLIANCWIVIGHYLGKRYQSLKLALVPYGNYRGVKEFQLADSRVLTEPSLGNTRYDAVIADLRADMPDEWLSFLASCALANIPVYHSRLIVEQLSGRVKINHLSENIFGSLYTTSFYGIVKRICEISFVILLSPIWLFLMLVFGLLVKLESKGPIFFIQ